MIYYWNLICSRFKLFDLVKLILFLNHRKHVFFNDLAINKLIYLSFLKSLLLKFQYSLYTFFLIKLFFLNYNSVFLFNYIKNISQYR